jgi:Domain of unknown function (DUF4397)
MKKRSITIPVISMLLLSMAGCDKNEIKYGDFDRVSTDQALLKVNVVTPYASNPFLYIALDGNRLSSPMTSRTPFPGGGYNTGGGSTADYMVLAPGKHAFSVAIPKKTVGQTGVDSIVLFQTEITLEAGKNQSLHISDTAANTVATLITDNVAKPDSGFARYNFVNLMPNVPAIDLYYDSTNLVAANVPYKGSKEFTMAIPAATLSWIIRPAGAAATKATILAGYPSASTITNRRSYTVFASGFNGATDATRKPYVSFFLNW